MGHRAEESRLQRVIDAFADAHRPCNGQQPIALMDEA